MTSIDAFAEVALDRSGAAEQIAAQLRELILSGSLAPGTALTEVRLAEAFGVSRNTVRESLALSAGEGLVTRHARRGVSVTVLEPSDVRDIYLVRTILELAAIDAAKSVPKQRLEPLGRRVEALWAIPENTDWRRIVDADLAFHLELIRLLDSPRLENLFEQLAGELRLCILIANEGDNENVSTLAEQHERLYDLLIEGDTRGCAETLQRHLQTGERLLIEHFTRGPAS